MASHRLAPLDPNPLASGLICSPSSQVVAPTYARLLQRLASSVKPADAQLELESYYAMWPCPVEALAEPWLSLARRVLFEAHPMPLLHTSAGRGQWVPPEVALHVDGDGEEASCVRETLLADGKVRLPAWVVVAAEPWGLLRARCSALRGCEGVLVPAPATNTRAIS